MRQVGDVCVELKGHAQLIATVMESIQQLQSRHAAKPVSATDDFCPVYASLYPVPVSELLNDTLVAGCIGFHEPPQRIVGEYYAEAPGSVTRAAFKHGNIVPGICFFHQQGEIQCSWTPAETDYLQIVHVTCST